MEEIIEEGEIKGAIDSASKQQTETILKQMENSVCRIMSDKFGTGFFCKIELNGKKIPVLITNYHIINDVFFAKEKIIKIYFRKDCIPIKLNKDRKVYSSNKDIYDIMIMKIDEEKDKIKNINYLEFDDCLLNLNSELAYEDTSIYILHYPSGNEIKVSYGYGIKNKDKNNIIHYCKTTNGSSGSPILNLLTNKVIGIHKSFSKLVKENNQEEFYNRGTLLKYPYKDMRVNMLNIAKLDINDSDSSKKVKDSLKDALTCFICTAKVLDPMMCPQCKKLVCAKCIKKWFLDQQHQKCPYCQVPSSLNQMINLPFMNQLSEYFIKEIERKENMADKAYIPKNKNMIINQIIDEYEEDITDGFLIKHKKKDLCPKHNKEIREYYCVNCNTEHCAKCLLIPSNESKLHSGHTIIEINRKNKYNLEDINIDIKSLSNIIKDLNQYKLYNELESKLMEKREDFYKKMVDEFQKKIISETKYKSTKLNLNNKNMEGRLNQIQGIISNNKDTIIHFVENDDSIGLKEYHKKIKDYININGYKQDEQFEIIIKPSLKFFETNFNIIEIKESKNYNGEIIGELKIGIEGIDKPIELQFNQIIINEILINIKINLGDSDEEKMDYTCFLILKNKNSITPLTLNEKYKHNGILILGKTVLKNSLKNILDDDNHCNVKLIIAELKL